MDKPLTPQRAKQLQKQIKADQSRPLAPAEKPLKIENPHGFEDTLEIIARQKKSKTLDY